ncbi:bahd acyltransferase [Nicotiana attenuata]|uniref:Bahd acyltransferase n=2 Tax=Nicotiana attenuata TaxID=49451 RepID=A0A314L4K0_NICAT|nr:bahd acyltransferase [Nicotiana attenuata]
MINSSRLKNLKKSLSEILAHYYFLAGRLRNDTASVDCNDEGVPFLEAFVQNQRLEDILNDPCIENELRKSLLPLDMESFSSTLLLFVQVTFLECGGMVVGISATHKVLDTSSFITFLTDWASLARQDDPNFVLSPLNPIAKLLPPSNALPPSPSTKAALSREACVTNIYVFNPSRIALLKTKATSDNIPKPSRVDVVTSIMWKCLTAHSKRRSTLAHMINMRKRVDPPMHAHYIGNFVGLVEASKDETEKDIANMVALIRKGLVKFDNDHGKRLKGDEAVGTILEHIRDKLSLNSRKDYVDFYHFSSWCGYSFYDVDFGWGKPIMFNTIEGKFKNMIMLIDTKDRGVEARVTLSEQDMKMFEKNTELLTYATLKASFPIKE